MTFPNAEKIQKILKDIENKEPTLVIDYETASKSDILKYKLCQEFIRVIKEENITQVQLAKKLGVDKAIVNKIVHHKISHFTSDRLMDLFASIRPLEIFLKAS
tara:strand:- start:36 stop:344 length:309 start_codon:yes stop_codon:yes gene_type:complete